MVRMNKKPRDYVSFPSNKAKDIYFLLINHYF